MAKKKPVCKVDRYGYKEWRLNGRLHREDGPACEWPDGTKFWYLNGQCHRKNGPAVEDINGYKEWRLNNIIYTFQDYLKKLKEIGKSDKDIMLLALKYG
jgi:hypothetical protein